MDKIAEAEAQRSLEVEVEQLIAVSVHRGLTAWQILDPFLRACCDLHTRAGVEAIIKGRETG